MALNKKFFPKVSAAADTFTPSEHFNTVLYTGNGSTQKIGGYINRGAVFNGSSSYIDLGNNSSNNGSLISVSCWFKTISTSAGMIWNNGGQDSSSTGLALSTTASGVLYFQGNTTTTFVNDTGTTTVNDGNWHHVVANYDNGDFNVYLDGNSTPELTGTSSAFTTTANQNFLIGRLSRVATSYFNGVIDQFRIFNRELTTSEVSTLYGETHSSTTISTTDIFSDNSGVALYQLDGNANDTGGASGRYGAAAIFNGSNSTITIPDNSVFDFVNATSMSLFVNRNTTNRDFIIDKANGGSGSYGWQLEYFGTTKGYQFQIHNTANSVISNLETGANSTTGNWEHIVVTHNGSGEFKIYFNGVLKATQTLSGTISTNTGDVKIGTYQLSSGFEFDGIIDEVRIYSDVLNLTEVGYIYNNTTASIPTDNLEAYYKLDGDARDEQQLYDGAASNVTYAYDGTASNITYQEATKFSPDLVWVKQRTGSAANHVLFDSVRGVHKQLMPNTDSSGVDRTSVDKGVTSFDSNGFTVKDTSHGDYEINGPNGGTYSGNGTYVAWCFEAGGNANTYNINGTGYSTRSAAGLTSGTIADSKFLGCSTNTAAGFSIIEYNGSGASAGQTIDTGLTSDIELMIIKNIDSTGSWVVVDSHSNKYHFLNSSAAGTSITFTDYADGTKPKLYDFATFIHYCFHSVAGYQKIGTYSGDGTTSGHIIETGFEPAFLMIKGSSHGGSWAMLDNERSTTNPRDEVIYADSNGIEGVNDVYVKANFLSNGFELKTNDSGINMSGRTYIYLAIAADPDTTTPTVADSFDVVTYTGNGATNQDIETDFKPDLIWVKSRSTSKGHIISDSVRVDGTLNSLPLISSNLTDAESSGTDAGGAYIRTINSNGFSVGNSLFTGASSTDYVAWVWKAGDHDDNLPQINTEGSIDSTVSVNDAAGFSIVKYTGTGSDATIGHGLSSAPQIIFVKRLDTTAEWVVGETVANDFTKVLRLDTTAASSTATYFNSTDPTSTVFSVRGASAATGGSGNFIAYCWYSVTGHSKIGTYSGTGASGNTVTLGFQPRWILIKRVDSADRWLIADTQRADALTNIDDFLDAQDSAAEGSFGVTNAIDIEPNGFEINSTDGAINASGTNNYVYMAFK